MSPSTFYALMNESEKDFEHYTLADAVGYAEFEEDVQSWEDTTDE